MTKLESIKCEKLLNEAIEYAIDAKDKLDVAARHPNATERYTYYILNEYHSLVVSA